ncbi:MAG: large conductance mechanosensitive channel protein MscL [Arenicella sp.]
MLKEFKEFALKGNFFDMAVGIVIGASFSTIVKSLVDDIIMPIVGFFSGGIDFKEKFINLSDGEFETLVAAKEAGAAVITYGNFISAIITFVIVAFVLFLIVKGMNKAMDTMKEEEEAAPSEPSDEVKLLTEIRDSLSK